MTQDASSSNPESLDPEDEDQDAGPTTMAPPGEGADAEGQAG